LIPRFFPFPKIQLSLLSPRFLVVAPAPVAGAPHPRPSLRTSLINQGTFCKKSFKISSSVFKQFFGKVYIISKIQDGLKTILKSRF
jgi:hypothetical protein